MKIKTKLSLGVGLLFILIIVEAVTAIWCIHFLKNDTSNILTANYNTIEYGRNMLEAIDGIDSSTSKDEFNNSVNRFEYNLKKQFNNITEPGEDSLTNRLASDFQIFISNINDAKLKKRIRADIIDIMEINMKAILYKSEKADRTSELAATWIGVVSAICFLVSFVLLFNLPISIAEPIQKLTYSIREIASRNYQERVHINNNSEFGELARSFNIMAEKLEEYEKTKISDLLIEKKRIDTLIDNMKDPILGLDEKGTVIFANREMLKALGISKEKLVGSNIYDLAKKNDLIRILLQEMTQSKEVLTIYIDNKECYFQKEFIHVELPQDNQDKPIYVGSLILLRNITPFKELDIAKTNFIATISHELKTPISSIMMSIQILENLKTGSLNHDQLELIESIKDDANRMLKIISELLDVTRLETGNIQLHIHSSDPYSILQYAIDATKIQQEQKHIEIIMDVEKGLPNIQIDAEKTAWVLTNFITNSIRYSPEGGQIIISLKKRDNKIEFLVQDFGKGIDEKYKTKIFERYFQVPGSNQSGTGLGLAISKDFIESQGGEIGVESEPGMGSRFYFRFPLSTT